MKISILTLGCKVNQYESGGISEKLKKQGHDVTENLEFADVYIINTCAVTMDAEKKSRQLISKCNKQNEKSKIIVMGCASQNKFQQFEKKDNVSYLLGSGKKELAAQEVEKIFEENQEKMRAESFILPTEYEDSFEKSKHKTRAFLKVQDGCNNFCSYCIIPYLRGRSRSRKIESIEQEILMLDNVKEIVLVGIDLSDYEFTLENLAKMVDTHNIRFRFGSLEVGVIDEKLLNVLKKCKNFCPQFHLSLQAGDTQTLKFMNRKYTVEEYYEKVNLIRNHFENPSITTDIIVGFPTETEEQFQNSLNFAQKVGFSDIHVFPYSVRTGTVASKKYQDLPSIEKIDRQKKMTEVKNQLIKKYIDENISKVEEVLTEKVIGKYAVGHTRNFLKCYVENGEENQIYKVKFTAKYKEGLVGEPIEGE